MGGLTPFCKPSLPSLHMPEALEHCPPLRSSAQEPIDPLCWSLQPHSRLEGRSALVPATRPTCRPHDLTLCGTPPWHLPRTVPPTQRVLSPLPASAPRLKEWKHGCWNGLRCAHSYERALCAALCNRGPGNSLPSRPHCTGASRLCPCWEKPLECAVSTN